MYNLLYYCGIRIGEALALTYNFNFVEAGKNWYIIVIKLDVFFIVIGLKFCPIALISA